MEFDIIYSAVHFDGEKQTTGSTGEVCLQFTQVSFQFLNGWVYFRKCALTATYFSVTAMMFGENNH
jgi:hypothetical protein